MPPRRLLPVAALALALALAAAGRIGRAGAVVADRRTGGVHFAGRLNGHSDRDAAAIALG